ncbi:MAG: cell division protein SepF [Symbiobacteriaceae bacterium]|nr:cell division protein SepF [Symbiobacteriaceae bacterium]
MAGLMNWFWDKVGLGDPAEDEEEDLTTERDDLIASPPQVSSNSKVVPLRGSTGAPSLPSSAPKPTGSVSEVQSQSQIPHSQVVVFVPQKLDDLPELVRHLREGRLVVTSFDGTNEGEMQYWLNFIFGAACALDGTAQKISRSIYLVAPRNVDITSNLKEILLARDNQERGRDSRLSAIEDFSIQ